MSSGKVEPRIGVALRHVFGSLNNKLGSEGGDYAFCSRPRWAIETMLSALTTK